MKAKVKHLYEIIAGAILSLLGFGCSDYRGVRVEYGEPHADYRIVGTVSSDETGNPIPGIKATFKRYVYTDDDGEEQYESQEFITDSDGKIDSPVSMFPLSERDDYLVVLEDIDGEDNGGLFSPEVIARNNITLEQTQKGDGRWYNGAFMLSFNAKMYKELAVEYGMPHANYRIIGKVTDQEENPIPDIEVLARLWGEDSSQEEEMLGTRTDQDGNYVLTQESWPGAQSAHVQFTDTDGEENGGQFEPAAGDVSFEQTAQGDGRWYEGDFSGELDVKLKKAEE